MKPVIFEHLELSDKWTQPGNVGNDGGGSAARDGVPCQDCGEPYLNGIVLTKKQWLMVHPPDAGMLCPSCILGRAEQLPGFALVLAHISFGQDYEETANSLEAMLTALRLENADYARSSAELSHDHETLRQLAADLLEAAPLAYRKLAEFLQKHPTGFAGCGGALEEPGELVIYLPKQAV